MTTASGDHLEVIHHPGYDTAVFMPFVPAIKVKSGKLLWLSGGTALPVYHDHPHQRDQIVKHLPNDLEAQVRQTMDGIMASQIAAVEIYVDGTFAPSRYSIRGACGVVVFWTRAQRRVHPPAPAAAPASP